MNAQVLHGDFKNRLYFNYLDVDLDLKKDAYLKMIQVLAYAPPGATGVGTVEKTEGLFLTTLAVRSAFRTFEAKAIGNDDWTSIRKAYDRLEDEIFRWRSGSGSAASSTPKLFEEAWA